MKKNPKKEEIRIRNIFNIIKKRKFKGYTGLVIKNSIYQFLTTLTANLGSFLFMIILARILMPELFGLYSLALSTILLFVSFSNLGIGETLVRFVSKELGKGNKAKAKAYAIYLTKIKIFLTLIIAAILLILAKFIATTYYSKPIFLALLIGPLYLFFTGAIMFIQMYFQAANNFKVPFFKEVFSQALKLALVPLIVLYALKNFASIELRVLSVIASIVLVWIFTLIFFIILTRKKLDYLSVKTSGLSSIEKKRLRKFLLAMFAFVFSGVFFGYIDMIFLGHFVLSNFVGYYRVAFSLVEVVGPVLALTTVLLPIFSRIKGKRLERGFKKSVKVTLLMSSFLFLFVIIFASPIIRIVYGADYLTAVPILRLLVFLMLSLPLMYLYGTYFISKGKPWVVTKLLTISTIINIILNYFFITWLINYSQLAAVYGICIATLISRYFYLFGLILYKKRKV